MKASGPVCVLGRRALRESGSWAFSGCTVSRGACFCYQDSWGPRHLPIIALHSVICPPHNQSSAAGWLNYRLWADGGDGCGIAVQRGGVAPATVLPSPDSRHPRFWRTSLPAPAIRASPFSSRAHLGWSKLECSKLPQGPPASQVTVSLHAPP